MTIQTGKYTDIRDGKVYRTVLMPDNKWWSVDNLAYAASYDSIHYLGIAHGYLYPWYPTCPTSNVATTIPIPANCHLPSTEEYLAIAELIGWNCSILRANDPAWKYGFVGTDALGFSAYPSKSSGVECRFWTSTVAPEGYTAVQTAGLISYSNSLDITTVGYNPTLGYSVRFIVDAGNVPDNAPTASFNISVNDNGTWKTPKEIWVNQNGVWIKIKEVYTSNGSAWKKS